MKVSSLCGPLCLLLIFAFPGCVKRPSGVASDKKMAPVIADLELGEAWLQNSSSVTSDADKEALRNNVLRAHGMTQAEFDTTMLWYAKNPDAYFELCDLAEKELKRKERRQAGMAMEVSEGSNLWPYSRMMLISTLGDTDGIIFSVPTSEVDPGARVKFKMRLDKSSRGETCLGVDYADGSSELRTLRLSGSPRLDVTLYTDTGRRVTRIFGNFTLDDFMNRSVRADSISLSVLPFDSTQFYNRHSQKVLNPPSRKIIEDKSELKDSLSSRN